MSKYRICTECPIHHIENCHTCLGFGIRKKRLPEGCVPIIAAEAHGYDDLPEWERCPECESTPSGIMTIYLLEM